MERAAEAISALAKDLARLDLSPGRAGQYAEALSRCLDEIDAARPWALAVSDSGDPAAYDVHWQEHTDQIRRAWAAPREATEDGAVAIALRVACCRRQSTVLYQAGADGTGCDWFLTTADDDTAFLGESKETWVLEVSGTMGDEAVFRKRLNAKVKQVQTEQTKHLRRVAAVVGFALGQLVLEEAA